MQIIIIGPILWKTKFFSHYAEPSCGLQSVVNARLSLAMFQKVRMQYKIVSLKVTVSWFSKYVFLAHSRILDRHFKIYNMKMFDKWLVHHTVKMHIHINVSSHSRLLVWKRNCRTSSHVIFCVRRWNCGTWSQSSLWKRNYGTSKHYSLCGSGMSDLKVDQHSMCGSGTVELSFSIVET